MRALPRDDGGHLGGRPFGLVVDDDLVELVLGGDLGLGDLEPAGDRLRRSRSPARAAVCASSSTDGGATKISVAAGHGLPDGPRALQLDLEDDIIACRELRIYVGAQRAVQVAPVVYPLEEVPRRDGAPELARGKEVVVRGRRSRRAAAVAWSPTRR